MNYYIDLFSPETAKMFEESNREVSGYRVSRKTYIENKHIGNFITLLRKPASVQPILL